MPIQPSGTDNYSIKTPLGIQNTAAAQEPTQRQYKTIQVSIGFIQTEISEFIQLHRINCKSSGFGQYFYC